MIARVSVVLAVLSGARVAVAAEVTRVVSALDDENRFDFNVTMSWLHEGKSAFVKREGIILKGDPTVPGGTIPVPALIKDLEYAQTRDVLNLRMDFGILWDVGLHIAAPLVLSDQRRLSFDRSAASGCNFTKNGGTPTCVDQSNSSILTDGILPSTPPMGMTPGSWGLGNQYSDLSSSSTVFQGPKRAGFESLDLGITWAAFNQLRDDTRPTWTLGFEAKLDVFKDMRFDRDNPNANTAVGPGYHQFIWSTFVSKRFRHFDPYFGSWFMLPARTNGSIYEQFTGGNQTAVNPMMRAAVLGGFEQIAWENPRASQRVTVEFRGRAEHHFYGRSASELWEPLAGSPRCAATLAAPACRPGIDDGVLPGTFMAHPGVTETQPYASFGGDAGLNVQVGKYARFRGLFGLTVDMPHFLTYAGTGIDHNNDHRVASDSLSEANVTYRDAVDAPGRRFKVEGTQIWSLLLEGSLMF
jgi:hypothetical protein